MARERRVGGRRRAIGGHQCTDTGADPGSASSGRPRGTTLRATRELGRKPRDGGARQIGGSGVAITCEITVEKGGIAEKHVVGIQLVRLATESADRLQPRNEMRLRLGNPALHLSGRGPLGIHLCELRRDRLVQLLERVSRCGGGHDVKVAGKLAGVLRRRDFGGNALLVHERAVQPRRLPPGQHVSDEIERGIFFSEQRRGMPREVQARQLDSIFEQQPLRRPSGEPDSRLRRDRRSPGDGRSPKYFSARSKASSMSTSPARASDAFAGW